MCVQGVRLGTVNEVGGGEVGTTTIYHMHQGYLLLDNILVRVHSIHNLYSLGLSG